MGAAEISGHAGKPTGGLSLRRRWEGAQPVSYLHPDSEHWLDRIHITVLQQQVKLWRINRWRWQGSGARMESNKHFLWHGNTFQALQRLGESWMFSRPEMHTEIVALPFVSQNKSLMRAWDNGSREQFLYAPIGWGGAPGSPDSINQSANCWSYIVREKRIMTSIIHTSRGRKLVLQVVVSRTGSLVFSPLPWGEIHIFSVRRVVDYIQSEGQSASSAGSFAVGALYAHRLPSQYS
jgi:hypothetical protein